MSVDRPSPPEPEDSGWSVPVGRSAHAEAGESRYRSGMLPRFGLFYWLSGLGLFLRPLRLEEHSAEHIRNAHKAGPLVYVLHTRSVLDWLVFNQVLNRNGLPLAHFSNGLRSTLFRPIAYALREWWIALRRRVSGESLPEPVASGWLAQAVSEGMTSCLFLVQSGMVMDAARRAKPPDVVAALVEAQERCERPIQVVPVVVAWRR